MKHTHHHSMIIVVYDGIENSVFQSQVLQPALKKLETCPFMKVTIVSFELKKSIPQELVRLADQHDRLQIIVRKKIPFLIPGGLWTAAFLFYKLLPYGGDVSILARGPMAGLIALRAIRLTGEKIPLLVQARGLCAEEYRYAHETASGFARWWHWLRYQQFKLFERRVYCSAQAIEAVSPSLKEYLHKGFGVSLEKVVVALDDIPETIDQQKTSLWHSAARRALDIPSDAYVYCYSGSYKPWQCAPESIAYVLDRYQKEAKTFFLVLSQDADVFYSALAASGLPCSRFRVLSVAPHQLLYYLAAADAGLLFRKSDIVNWVSRPTKALEYRAVGLKVIHNGTVGWLALSSPNE